MLFGQLIVFGFQFSMCCGECGCYFVVGWCCQCIVWVIEVVFYVLVVGDGIVDCVYVDWEVGVFVVGVEQFECFCNVDFCFCYDVFLYVVVVVDGFWIYDFDDVELVEICCELVNVVVFEWCVLQWYEWEVYVVFVFCVCDYVVCVVCVVVCQLF